MSEASSICRSSRRSSMLPRRALLRGAGQTSLAASLVATGLARPGHAEARTQEETPEAVDCPDLLVFSKKSFQPGGGASCNEPCKCGDDLVYRDLQDSGVLLAPSDCDETATLIPEGSALTFLINRTLRLPGPEGTWVGSHEGTFFLQLSGGSIEGRIWGISGMDSSLGGCQYPEHDEGMLVGQGTGDLEGCSLMASYHGDVRFGDRKDPCSIDWATWYLDLRGILSCRCEG